MRLTLPAGARAELNLGVGKVTLANVSGSIEVETASGDVEGKATAASLSIDTGSGDVTLTGAGQKLFHEDPRIGFLSQARALEQRIADGRVPAAKVPETRHVIFNNRLDAGVTGFFALPLILLLLAEAANEWYRILTGKREARTTETPYVRSRWGEGSP